jgi:hypothetical protein
MRVDKPNIKCQNLSLSFKNTNINKLTPILNQAARENAKISATTNTENNTQSPIEFFFEKPNDLALMDKMSIKGNK